VLPVKETPKGQTFCHMSEDFSLFPVSTRKLKGRDRLRRARVGLGSDGVTISPPGLGHPHPLVEPKPVIHYKDPTKLRLLFTPQSHVRDGHQQK